MNVLADHEPALHVLLGLSPTEFLLLAHLVAHQGEICTREELLAAVWGINFDPGTNMVDVYVRRLRTKLGPDAIETVRNAGYRLVASEAASA